MIARLIIQTFLWFGIIGLVLFVAAGTTDWAGAWIYLGAMMLLSLGGGLLLARYDPGLLNERLSSPIQRGQPMADKILLSVLLLSMASALVLMAVDAVRFEWSHVPSWVQAIGALTLLLSVWISYRTMRENSFAAPVVRIQKERGQKVITTGPYRLVRHPLYTGAIVYFVGASLLLGSWWGLAAVLVLAVLLSVRIRIEERALRAGLEGYGDYAERVRYRLIPLLW